MTMPSYRKLFVLSSTTIAFFFGEIATNIACGPEVDPYDNQTTYYLPNLEDNGFSAFQYIPYQFLYTEEAPAKESLVNSEAWAKHLGPRVNANDIEQLMYRSDSATADLASNQKRSSWNNLPDSVKGNTFLQALIDGKHEPERAYFVFTKKQEPITNVQHNYWDPDTRNFKEIVQYAELAEAQINKHKKNSFLFVRYAYQAARLYLFGQEYGKSIAIYENYLQPIKGNDAILNWALSNYAGAVRKNGDGAKAAYLFSKLFTASPERRVLAYSNFHYITASDTEIFQYATNDADKFNINAIIGFGTGDRTMKYLNACYQLDPANTVNAVLLGREVNKIEGDMNESFYIGYGENYNYYSRNEDKNTVKQHLDSLRNFALNLYQDKKYVQPQLGLITAAYLSWMNKENDLAKKYLALVKERDLNPKLADQYQITALLTQLADWQTSKQIDQPKLVKTLAWLEEKAQRDSKNSSNKKEWSYSAFEYSNYSLIARNILQNLVVKHYLSTQDTAMASLAAVKADIFYNYGVAKDSLEDNMQWSTMHFWENSLTPKTLLKIRTLLSDNTQQNTLSRFLLEDIKHFNRDYLTELLGTAYLRELDFQNAAKTLQALPKDHKIKEIKNSYSEDENNIIPSPFIVTINDYPKKYGKENTTKLKYAERMARLENAIKSEKNNQKKADYYFQMATGIYQTSTYGNAWSLVSYDWSSTDSHAASTIHWQRNYLQTKSAKEWYSKARSLSSDKGFKAKCTFMLAKCEQKDFAYTDETRWQYYDSPLKNPFYRFSLQNKYFKELNTHYKDTPFFNMASKECTYLRDYLNLTQAIK
ncbi:hypothetical protein D7322_03130 [Sphingobacterium puteale]|uniref:Uncharacterized protein n=1 Tax=Sphingobacterium puteale TaxID=2420510 RepID=A0A420W4X3_9SPHI|nr:hypothetical protein [Sphingobacterium puteale]RKO73659.1 hypothetical protein D7322_03130 [Sphingobacterium puteale]